MGQLRWPNPQFCSRPSDCALQTFADHLFPPAAAVELVLNMKAPKETGFRELSRYMSSRGMTWERDTGTPFPRPLCTREAYLAEWKSRCKPLKLDPPVLFEGCAGVSWPFAS